MRKLKVSVDVNATVKPAAGLSYFFSHGHILTGRFFSLIGIIGLVSSPLRGAWLSLSRTGHKVVAEPLRAVRLAQGKQGAEIAGTRERQKVIDAFTLASRTDAEKARRRMMEDRVQSMLRDGGAGTLMTEKKEEKENKIRNISPAPPPWGSMSANRQEVMLGTAMGVDEEETRFQKDLEEAIAASTRESQDPERLPNTEDEDERFERETKMATELSLKKKEEFERGLMQAEWNEREVEALPLPKT